MASHMEINMTEARYPAITTRNPNWHCFRVGRTKGGGAALASVMRFIPFTVC